MTSLVKVTFTNGTNKVTLSVPKGAYIEGKGQTYTAKEGGTIMMTKEQYNTAIALSKLDGNSKDLDADDFTKFSKMTKGEQTAYINKALGQNSKYKVGNYYSAITDETFGITTRKNFLSIPITENGKTQEDPPNPFVMSFDA